MQGCDDGSDEGGAAGKALTGSSLRWCQYEIKSMPLLAVCSGQGGLVDYRLLGLSGGPECRSRQLSGEGGSAVMSA